MLASKGDLRARNCCSQSRRGLTISTMVEVRDSPEFRSMCTLLQKLENTPPYSQRNRSDISQTVTKYFS
jgi:hypothetical protein